LRKIILQLLIALLCITGFTHAQPNSLINVKVLPLPDNRICVQFIFARPLNQLPASFITQQPQRLVLDFIESNYQLAPELSVKQVNLGSLVNYKIVAVGDRVRAILDLSDDITYTGTIAGKVYSLIIKAKGPQLISQRKEVFVTNRPVNAHFVIHSLDFRGTDKQGGRLVINVSHTGIPIEVVQRGKELIATFQNTRLPARLNKRYDVMDFHSPTQLISAQQDSTETRITLSNEGSYNHYAYQVNKQFIIDVFPLTDEELKQEKLKKRVFTGKRISLNFQKIPVRSVLQLLADFTGTNIVVGDSVAGDITLRLNDVPWDQALDIILSTQSLDKREVGNVILVDAAKNFTDREQKELELVEKNKKLAPVRAELLQINYAKAADIAAMLKDKDNSLLSARGNLSVDVRTNTIWLQDTGDRIEEIRDLVKQLDIPVQQVQIEARIVNVTKDCSEDLGIRWGVSRPSHLSGTLEGATELARGTAPADVPISDRLNVDLTALPIDASPASIGIALAKLGNGVLLDLELSALESEGRAEIIASPRLMTVNQQEALIESGEDIPYQEATSSGATAVAFKKAVLSLKVTPQITPDGKLLMDLQINQDSDSGRRVQGVPIILTKAIETNVLVNNGQTIVLGGIYRQDNNNTITRVPFLGSLPVLGALFRRTQQRNSNEELLIFITPRIITNNLSITAIQGRPPMVRKTFVPLPQRPWKQ
jgi:type IV pilus assembly protein PilQ